MKQNSKTKTGPRRQNLIWIDMEMTGLNPERDGILEIACIATDKDLNILEEGPDLVIHQPEKLLKGMDAWNQQHHKKSGLLDAVRASKISLREAERQILEFVKKYGRPKKTVLCGNTIYQDRRFIIKYMPQLEAHLHYRLVDVSTIKELVRRWYRKGGKRLTKKTEQHRALSDIRESIEELRAFRKHYFIQ